MPAKYLHERILEPTANEDEAIEDYLQSLDAFANLPTSLRRAKLRIADAILYRRGLPVGPTPLQVAFARAAYIPSYELPKWKCSKGKRLRIYQRDGYRCVRCGSPDDLTLDHIEPRVLGGSNSDDNLQTLCRPCNARKGSRRLV